MKPEATMFVPQCTILISSTNQLLELKGKFLGSLFGSKKLVELSSSDPAFIRHWIEMLGPIATQQETAVIDTPLPPQNAVAADTRSIHSKIQAENEPESSNLGGVTQNGASTAAYDNTTSMQPIDQGNTTDNFQPITNIPASDHQNHHNDADSDHDFARQTVEYSTHSPVAELETNPLQKISTTASSSDPATTLTGPSTPTGAMTPAQQQQDVHTPLVSDTKATTTPLRMPGGGPTREGSDIFWDTAA